MTVSNLVKDGRRALERLTRILKKDGGRSCTLFLHSKAGREKAAHWQRLKFDAKLSKSFRAHVVGSLIAAIEAREADEVQAFNFDQAVSGAICVLKTDIAEELAAWFDALPDHTHTNVFDGTDEKFLKRIDFHVTTIDLGDDENELHVFRHHGTASLVQKGFFSVFNRTEKQFEEVTGQVYSFDHNCDFLRWGEWIFVFDYRRFEGLTDARTLTASQAERGFDQIEKLKDVHIPQFEDIKPVILNSPMMARKLASAAYQGLIGLASGESLHKRIKEKPLDIKVAQRAGKYEFDLKPDDKEGIKTFVRLIADDYLKSSTTKVEWTVNAKNKS